MDPLKIFYSYSHKDENFRESLETRLKLLVRKGALISWHDRKITAGSEWEKKIDHELKSADIILLMISADFLASDYCYEKEMEIALQLHDSKQAIVIPIILRPIDWKETPFAKLQTLPKGGTAITLWNNEDEAWVDVTSGISTAIEEINNLKFRKTENSEFHKINDLLRSEISTVDRMFKSFLDDTPSILGIRSGFTLFDSYLHGLMPAELIAISGRSESLRSSFALQIANYVAANEKKGVGYFSFNCSAERVTRKLLVSESKIPDRVMAKGLLDETHWPSLAGAVGRIKDLQLHIDDNISLDLDDIKIKTKKLIDEKNVALIVIDGLDALLFNEKQKNKENHPEVVIKKLSMMAKTLNICVVLTTNVDRKIDQRIMKRPSLHDLHCIGFLDEIADKVIFLYSEEFYEQSDLPQETIEAIVAKNSFVNADIGTFFLTFYSNLSRFENVTE
ncbi:DnaB-like helicase C-terminal domain-containing protein [Cellvibrio sp. UBA7671]|uniref:DnaB-like helicase C-terminal domain-containing protein n=1 Tax=Cellvibrio sp. UBA7671 TaxID=1946312 RepID=UPI002F34FF4F